MSKPNLAQIQQKYAEEREKRITRGNRNYRDPVGAMPELGIDIWRTEEIDRAPIAREVDAVITGTGIAGLLTAVRLEKSGTSDFLMFDVASDYGGAWYWNRYPGIRCDVEAYIYLPLIEEVGTVPTERYATGTEIRAHCRALAEKFDLPRRTLFQTKVTGATWDAPSARWIITSDRGDRIAARFLLATSGFQHVPKVPDIPGLEKFKGRVFHPTRWDYGFSGGSPDGGLTGLADKSVTLVGTGATGIQILPHLARDAKVALLVQRTPAAVAPRNNHSTDAGWFRSQAPGWQQARMDNFQAVTGGGAFQSDLVDDCWTRPARKLAEATAGTSLEEAGLAYAAADLEVMEGVRNRIDDIVRDPTVANALKPWYNLFCRRPLYADDYLEAFNAPNVTLIDTDGAGISEITETGFIANGKAYQTDCIVIASGFEVGAYEKRTSSFPIIGREGRSLADKWDEGIRSVHGLWINEFPNFQIVGSIYQAVGSFNYTWLADHQARHAASLIRTLFDAGAKAMEVSVAAEERWRQTLMQHDTPDEFFANCTPGYFNNEGDRSKKALYTTTFGGGSAAYLDILKSWRDGGYKDDVQLIN